MKGVCVCHRAIEIVRAVLSNISVEGPLKTEEREHRWLGEREE